MRVQDVIDYLESLYPLSEMEEWDHSGYQLGSSQASCKRVMIALNADNHTIEQAIAASCDLLITHHPFLFHPLTSVMLESYRGQLVAKSLAGKLTIYSMHTNYDRLRMNTLLLEKLGCQDIQTFESTHIPRLGKLPSAMSLDALIDLVKNRFNLPLVRYTGAIKEHIETIAICGGSGSEFVEEALAKADLYITGDFNYNHATNLLDLSDGLVLGVPHFLEACMKDDVKNSLSQLNIEVCLAEEQDYFVYR